MGLTFRTPALYLRSILGLHRDESDDEEIKRDRREYFGLRQQGQRLEERIILSPYVRAVTEFCSRF